MITNYIVYQSHLKPVGKGKLPDVIKDYVREPLPHITYTKDMDKAYLCDEDEAKELAYLLDWKVGRLDEWTVGRNKG